MKAVRIWKHTSSIIVRTITATLFLTSINAASFHSSLYSLLCLTEVKIGDNFIESPNLEPIGEFDLDGCAYDIKTEPWRLVNTHETC